MLRLRDRGSLGFLGVVLTATLIGIFAAFWAESVVLVVPFVAVVLGMLVLQVRMRFGTLSPIAILVVLYLTLAVSGPLVASAVAAGRDVSADISLSPSAAQGAYLVFITASGATVIGAALYSTVRPANRIRRPLLFASAIGSHRPLVAAAIFSVIPLGLNIAAHGTGLLSRTEYMAITDSGNALVIAAQTLALPAIAVLGWLTQTSVKGAGKFLSYCMLVVYALTLFSLGTRAFALLPLMFTLGVIAARPNSKRMRVMLLFGALAALPLLQVPLTLRASVYHGLLPYLQALSQGVLAFDLTGVASNVLFAFQLTGRVAFVEQPISLDILWISFDPRPASWVGWYDIQPSLGLNPHTPYNALGELANHGWLVLAGFFIVVGAYFGHLESQVRRLLSQNHGLAGLLLFALACVFIVTTLQYNLRSSVRILYYAIAFEVAISSARAIARHTNRNGIRPWSMPNNTKATQRIQPVSNLPNSVTSPNLPLLG